MKPVGFLPEAEQEMLEAASYYESQAAGLGEDYLSEIERAVASIAESPNTWPIIGGKLRRRLVRRFPFGIYRSTARPQHRKTAAPNWGSWLGPKNSILKSDPT